MKTITTIIFALVLMCIYNSDFAKEVIAENSRPTIEIFVADKTKEIQDDITTYYLVTNTNKFYKVSFKTYYSTKVNQTRTIRNPIVIEQLYGLYLIATLVYFLLLFFINGYQKNMF